MSHKITRADLRKRLDNIHATPTAFAKQRREELELRSLENRIRYLPHAIRAARLKMAALEQEARDLGMFDLLEERA